MPALEQMGEAMKAKPRKTGKGKSSRRMPDAGCPDATPFPFGGGVIMPHVVSPEIVGDEVHTPRILHLHPDLENQPDPSPRP